MRVSLRVFVDDERDVLRFGRKRRICCGVDADPGVPAELAQQSQKVALSASDLENALPSEPIPLYEPLRELAHEYAKSRRECLAVLVTLGIGSEARIERGVPDAPTLRAEDEPNVAPREALGRLECVEEHAAVGRCGPLRVEALTGRAPATRTTPRAHVRHSRRLAATVSRAQPRGIDGRRAAGRPAAPIPTS